MNRNKAHRWKILPLTVALGISSLWVLEARVAALPAAGQAADPAFAGVVDQGLAEFKEETTTLKFQAEQKKARIERENAAVGDQLYRDVDYAVNAQSQPERRHLGEYDSNADEVYSALKNLPGAKETCVPVRVRSVHRTFNASDCTIRVALQNPVAVYVASGWSSGYVYLQGQSSCSGQWDQLVGRNADVGTAHYYVTCDLFVWSGR